MENPKLLHDVLHLIPIEERLKLVEGDVIEIWGRHFFTVTKVEKYTESFTDSAKRIVNEYLNVWATDTEGHPHKAQAFIDERVIKITN